MSHSCIVTANLILYRSLNCNLQHKFNFSTQRNHYLGSQNMNYHHSVSVTDTRVNIALLIRIIIESYNILCEPFQWWRHTSSQIFHPVNVVMRASGAAMRCHDRQLPVLAARCQSASDLVPSAVTLPFDEAFFGGLKLRIAEKMAKKKAKGRQKRWPNDCKRCESTSKVGWRVEPFQPLAFASTSTRNVGVWKSRNGRTKWCVCVFW